MERLCPLMLFFGIFYLSSVNQAVASSKEQAGPYQETPTIQTSQAEQRYGHWLFNGSFSQNSFSAVNPEYRLVQGDKLSLQVWGAVNHQQEVVVDPQGYIFIPKVGPVKVLGVPNKKLNQVILKRVKRVYKSNVDVYASLLSSQKIKVFLSGMVNQPGMYEGQSADSVLRFIDQAGGIHQELGGYRNIEVKRHGKRIQQIDLYQFLQQGQMPSVQLQDGDVILVNTKGREITIEGLVGFSGRYEIKQTDNLPELLKYVVMKPESTHITLIHAENHQGKNEVEAYQFLINQTQDVTLDAGDVVKVSSQKKIKKISVYLRGEHNSPQEFVLPWGTSLGDLLKQVQYTALSNQEATQLFRKSIAKRQFDMLQATLSALEQRVLTTPSNSNEAAQLRKAEADIVLRWIEKARKVKPKGQVLLTRSESFDKIILQQGDEIVIPTKRHLVMIHGEVMFPTAVTYEDEKSIRDFIKQAGGVTTGDLDDMNILLMKPNGSFTRADHILKDSDAISEGDEIFVLSKPDEKSFQFAKDLTGVIYQVAVAAGVVLKIF